MSFQPIYGWSGNHPVLDFLKSGPVCMEVPNPHPPWTYVDLYSPNNCTVSVSTGEIKITSTLADRSFEAGLDVFLAYTGSGTINLAVSKSGGSAYANANGGTLVNGTGYYVSFNIGLPSPATGTIPVPYYRYRLRFAIGGGGMGTAVGDWIKLAVTFS